jgi:hypothetical protein
MSKYPCGFSEVAAAASLFTKKSHHRNISVMYIEQNLFHKGKNHRTISLNAHYMVLFKNPRDEALRLMVL